MPRSRGFWGEWKPRDTRCASIRESVAPAHRFAQLRSGYSQVALPSSVAEANLASLPLITFAVVKLVGIPAEVS